VPQDEQDPKVARLKRPGSSMQKAARSLAKEKSTRKAKPAVKKPSKR
jgi:hypothetical protein